MKVLLANRQDTLVLPTAVEVSGAVDRQVGPVVVMHLETELHEGHPIEAPQIFIKSILRTIFHPILKEERAHFRCHDISTEEEFRSVEPTSRLTETTLYDSQSRFLACRAPSYKLVIAWSHTYKSLLILTNNYTWQFTRRLILFNNYDLKTAECLIYKENADDLSHTARQRRVRRRRHKGDIVDQKSKRGELAICGDLNAVLHSPPPSCFSQNLSYNRDRSLQTRTALFGQSQTNQNSTRQIASPRHFLQESKQDARGPFASSGDTKGEPRRRLGQRATMGERITRANLFLQGMGASREYAIDGSRPP